VDEFGLVDADFLPYWHNAEIVAGQSDTVKCSVYRKPGDALLCVVNLTRQRQTAVLTIDWRKLTGEGAVSVTDALRKEPVEPEGEARKLAVEVEPLNFRLLRARVR